MSEILLNHELARNAAGNDGRTPEFTVADHERELFEAQQANAPGGSDATRDGYPHPSAPVFQDGVADNSGLKSWNDITSGISRDGGYHFTQDNQLYYRQGDRLHRANPMQGGDYSVSPVPGDEAGKIHDREILANGQPVYARNKVYTHHEGTVYGTEKRPDGSPRIYSLSPHEDEDVYAIAKTKGRSEGTAVQPMIDPIFVASSGLTGGVKAFVQTQGPTLYKLGSGLLGGAMGSGRSVGFQVLGSKLP